jgi:intracellular multiplication protein IcmC
MLPNRSIKRTSKRLGSTYYYGMLLMIAVTYYAIPAYAADVNLSNISAVTLLQNIALQVPALMQMITAIAYVMGMYFIFFGILRLKQYGEQRTMMSAEHHLKGPIIYIVVGTLLLYLPSSVQVGMSTFWTNPNPYAYVQEQTSQWGQFYNTCFIIIQLFGTIAFIRGLIILSHLAGHGGHSQGNFGRGLTHIIGGVFCINIYQFVQVIMATLGITVS